MPKLRKSKQRQLKYRHLQKVLVKQLTFDNLALCKKGGVRWRNQFFSGSVFIYHDLLKSGPRVLFVLNSPIMFLRLRTADLAEMDWFSG